MNRLEQINNVRSFLAGLLVIGMLFAPLQSSMAEEQASYYTLPKLPDLNPSVLSTAQRKFTTLTEEARAGYVHATSIAAAATALETLVAEMDSSGHTARIESWALANKELWTTFSPPEHVVFAGYASFRKTGSTMTFREFHQMILGIPLTSREAFLAHLTSIGLARIHKEVVGGLNALAASAREIELHGGRVSLVKDVTVPWASLGGAYFSVVMLSMAVMTGGTSVIVFAAIGVGLSAVSLYCGC